MPTFLAQSNLPKSAAVVVSSETIILRDPNNSILKKYTSDEQKDLSLKSYGIKPATMLSPGENKKKPEDSNLVFYDWLQNNPGAYIATLFSPQADYKYEIGVEYISGSADYQFGTQYLPGGDVQDVGRFSCIAYPGEDNTVYLNLYFSRERAPYTSIQGLAPGRQNLVIENGHVSVNGGENVELVNFDSSLKINQPLFIFGENRQGTFVTGGRTKLYHFKVYNSLGRLLLDLKPATLNNTPGLYDSVSRHFFENANTTGTFLIGNIGDTAGFGFGFTPSPEVTPNEEE